MGFSVNFDYRPCIHLNMFNFPCFLTRERSQPAHIECCTNSLASINIKKTIFLNEIHLENTLNAKILFTFIVHCVVWHSIVFFA